MKVIDQHKLVDAQWRPSPNHDERPTGAQLELVVLHCVSLPEGQFGTGYPEALFMRELDVGADVSFADLAGVEVAPHLFIDRQGQVTQFVSFDRRAWHAGASCWRHRERCNDYAIGIELEGSLHTNFTPSQYDALAEVVDALLREYPQLSLDAVVGHNEIAPLRKSDPGAYFDWRGLLLRLHQAQHHKDASAGL